MKKIKTVRGHTGFARFLAETEETGLQIARTIPARYSYSPTHVVYKYKGQLVIVVETKHAYHEVFLVEGQELHPQVIEA